MSGARRLRPRAAPLSGMRVLVLDVDGVLTDGRLLYGERGEIGKSFHVRDGHGIRALQAAGVAVAVVSGRRSMAVQRRCRELGIRHLRQGVGDKGAALEALLRALLVERFCLPSTNCHMARVLLMTNREEEAREQIRQGWFIHRNAPTYVVGRMLFFRIIFALFDGAEISDLVEQLKAILQQPGADLDWTIRPMLEHLRPRFSEVDYRFLDALAATLSNIRNLPQLEPFPQWAGTAVLGVL